MDPSEFKAAKAGRVVTTPEGYAAFVPAPLPPRLTFTQGARRRAVARRRRPGRAVGAGRRAARPGGAGGAVPAPGGSLLSRIEGADVSLTEVLLARDRRGVRRARALDQLDEVRNALATLDVRRRGRRDAAAWTWRSSAACMSACCAASRRRRARRASSGPRRTGSARPARRRPTRRTSRRRSRRCSARLEQLEGFMAERDRLPDLVQCAMAHAQFESIHPFVGGNGRLGRILIVLFLAGARTALAAAAVPLRVPRGAPPRVLLACCSACARTASGCRGCSSSPRACARRRSTPTTQARSCCASAALYRRAGR